MFIMLRASRPKPYVTTSEPNTMRLTVGVVILDACDAFTFSMRSRETPANKDCGLVRARELGFRQTTALRAN